MMKRVLFMMLVVFLAMSFGCTSLTPESVREILMDKTYYVVFEKEPGITDKGVYAEAVQKGLQIGSVQSQTPGAAGLMLVKISVKNEHDGMMKDNVVFYVSGHRLEYETVGDSGKPLSEGAKLLGFNGKPSLYWFKTKTKVKSISDAAVSKAQELYEAFEK